MLKLVSIQEPLVHCIDFNINTKSLWYIVLSTKLVQLTLKLVQISFDSISSDDGIDVKIFRFDARGFSPNLPWTDLLQLRIKLHNVNLSTQSEKVK